ncbi:MAG: hypothetical protein KAS39_01610, partial [Actinomycetia bacterium]|nr:hypothetical protein [Actinomycetes bacterium]
SGFTWYITGWAGFMLFFFTLWEIRILCSHCPYYAEKGKTIHCIANYGMPKLWKYRPGPVSMAEKIQLFIGFIILFGYPFPFMIIGRKYMLAVFSLWGVILFFWTLQKYTCTKCVNFSCPLNRVEKEVVDQYLRKNPVMRKAWEENGWKF